MRTLLIPDVQAKPDVPLEHLTWAGQYAVDMKPDAIVCIGDWWDMPSLSSYDKGKKSFEGRRYVADCAAGNEAMELFMAPIKKEIKRLKRNKKKQWNPRLIFCMGNHENRIMRAVESSAELEGVLGYHDLNLDDWEVYDFLEVVNLNEVMFSHYFTSGVMGRPVSSAKALLNKQHMSCVMGHVQDRDIAFAKKADGTWITGLFCGIFYQHDEEYLGHQNNNSWRGVWVLNEMENGRFDELPVSMKYLESKYE